MTFFLLYIDPGTGSALFSILIGMATALYFLGRALLIKLKIIISGGKINTGSEQRNPFIIYNEGKQYSDVFRPVLEEFENRKINVLFLTSSEDDPLLENNYHYVKKEYIGQGNKAFSRLNVLNANIVLMTTPGLDVYQLKRSRNVDHYSHLLHMPSDATMYRLYGLDYFDSVLLSGTYQAKDIKVLEEQRGISPKQLVTVGCTYLDVFREILKNNPKEVNHKYTILVSPSWGPSSLLSRFGEKLLDELVKTNFQIIVRPHPQSKKSENTMLKNLEERYKNFTHLEWDYARENIYTLSKTDIMISDYSGIIYDFIFLFNKPVLYINQGIDIRPYDADDLGENAINELWQFKTLKEIGIELKEEDFPHLSEIIENVSGSVDLKNARNKAREDAWQYQGEAGKRTVDFLLRIYPK